MTLRPTPLLFIHGFKGARLVDSKNHTVWITGAQACGLSAPNLALPMAWQDGVQQRDGISAAGVLERVTVVPGILKQEVYGTWLRAAANFKKPFTAYAYDWRRDCAEAADGFRRLIDKTMKERQVSRVDVVAHSLGGLIALSLALREPELFRKIFFVGVPFRGGIGFLPDLHTGVSTGLNKKITSPEVLFTFPSVYALFDPDASHAVDGDGKPVALDFYSARDWREHRLSAFAVHGRDHESDFRFLSKALERAAAFRASLKKAIPAKFPETTVIVGRKFKTLNKSLMTRKGEEINWDFNSLPRIDGDGRVGAANLPPPGIKYDIFHSDTDHVNLLNDRLVIAKIHAAVGAS